MPDISPQEFGRLQAEVAALRRDVDRITETLDGIANTLQQVQQQLSEAKGGWRVLMLIGGASATAGAGITKLASWWLQQGPGVGP